MQVQIKMISTRPNTNTDFWWTTTDSTVVSFRDKLTALFAEHNVPSALTISSDGLTCTMTYTVEEGGQWTMIVDESKIRIPNLGQNRRNYHTVNNQTFKLEVRSLDNDLLQEVPIIPPPSY